MTKGVINLQKGLKKMAEFAKEEFSDYVMPHIVFNSCREALVEGSKGILEYNNEKVRLNCGKCILKFCGDNLCIRALNTEAVIITGEIVHFEFCNI